MASVARDTYYLPPEVWAGICDRLSLRDIANFRLACHFCGRIGAPYLVREIAIRMEIGDFDRFRTLANDLALSAHVQSLLYTPNVYCLIDAHMPPAPSDTYYQSRARSQGVEAEYKQICEDQIRIQDGGLESVLFSETLPKLTNLRRVVIRCDGWPPVAFCKKHWERTKGGWRNPRKRPHNNGGIPGRRALATVFKALAGCDTRLLVFKAGRVHWRAIEDLSRARPQLDLFSNLSSLTLQFCICHLAAASRGRQRHPDQDQYCRLRENGLLPEFLAALSGLETLAIGFCAMDMDFKRAAASPLMPWLVDVVSPGHSWPCLTSLAFSGFNFTKAQLLDFLQRHSETLRRVEFQVSTLDSNWTATVSEIRAMLPLKDALVWCCLYDPQSLTHQCMENVEEERVEALRAGKHLTYSGVCPVTDSHSVTGYCLRRLSDEAKSVSRN